MKTQTIDGIGDFIEDKDLECYESKEVPMGIFNGKPMKFIVHDMKMPGLGESLKLFMNGHNDVLLKAEQHIFQYYKDMEKIFKQYDWKMELRQPINSANDVWENITTGDSVVVEYRDKDKQWYFSIECNCRWEVEHGLQIVIRGNNEVCKIGPYDGHILNEEACNDLRLVGVVYKKL